MTTTIKTIRMPKKAKSVTKRLSSGVTTVSCTLRKRHVIEVFSDIDSAFLAPSGG